MSERMERIARRSEDVLVDKALGVLVDLAFTGAFTAYGLLSGSFEKVAAFASENPEAAVSWSATILLVGTAVGFAVRHAFAVKRMKRELDAKDADHGQLLAEKDAEIAKLNAEIVKLKSGIVGLEEVDAIIRYLPDDMAMQLAYIYATGGSINAEPRGVLQALVKSRLLIMDGSCDGLSHWRLSPGAMKYIDEHQEFLDRSCS